MNADDCIHVGLLHRSEGAADAGGAAAQLVSLAERGLLPINSQPALNALPSSDDVHGWGGEGG